MASVDTNALVRLVVLDDAAQHKAILGRLRLLQKRGEVVFVSSVVLAELAWVLDSVYGYERGQIAVALQGIVETPPLFSSDRPAVMRALELYERGTASFSDYLILELARDQDHLPLLTFDRKLLKTPGSARP